MDKMYNMSMYLTIPKIQPEQPKELTERNQITESNQLSERIQNEGGRKILKKGGHLTKKKQNHHVQKEGGKELSEVEEEKFENDSTDELIILSPHELDFIKYETLA